MDSFSGHETGGTRRLGPGTRLGYYELREPLGKGGMGQVWMSFDTQGERLVAVKVLPPEFQGNDEAIDQVRAAFRVVHALTHQHISKTIGLFNDATHGPYIVMDLVRRQPLSRYAWNYRERHGSIPLSRVIELLGPVAEALDYAHRKEVLHRDIKPQNILVDASEDLSVGGVTLIDFGLAAEIRSTMTQHTKGKVETQGTRPYMSPEQMRGKRRGWDGRTDQYALAVVAYELLAGNLPFEGDDGVALMLAILNEPADPIPEQPPAVNGALLRGLSKNREERFASCRELVSALSGPSTAVPPAASSTDGWTAEPVNPSGPKRWTVPSPECRTIMDGIARAKAGDTVLIQPGVYREKIELCDGVRLAGTERDRCVLKLAEGAESIISGVNLAIAAVSGLTLEGDRTDEGKADGIHLVNCVAKVTSCVVRGLAGDGIAASGTGTQLEIDSCLCEENGADGISITEGAKATVQRSICRRNESWGVLVGLGESSAQLIGNTCQENEAFGIGFINGGRGEASNNTCCHNKLCGLGAIGEQCDVAFTDNLTEENGDFGITIQLGARLRLTRNTCRLNGSCGIAIRKPGTRATLSGNRCEKNRQHGISFEESAVGDVTDCVSSGNDHVGLLLSDQGTKVSVTGCVLDGNNQSGLMVQSKASASAAHTACCGNSLSGIVVAHAGTEVRLEKMTSERNGMSGLKVQEGACAEASDCTCKENKQSGFFATSAGTRLGVTGSVGDKNRNHGLAIRDGAVGEAKANNFRFNDWCGVMTTGNGTAVTIGSNSCHGNEQDGITAQKGATLHAERNFCRKNIQSGIEIRGRETGGKLIANECEENLLHGIRLVEDPAILVERNVCQDNRKWGIATGGLLDRLWSGSRRARLAENVDRRNGAG